MTCLSQCMIFHINVSSHSNEIHFSTYTLTCWLRALTESNGRLCFCASVPVCFFYLYSWMLHIALLNPSPSVMAGPWSQMMEAFPWGSSILVISIIRIWYNNIPVRMVVWVANQLNAIKDYVLMVNSC